MIIFAERETSLIRILSFNWHRAKYYPRSASRLDIDNCRWRALRTYNIFPLIYRLIGNLQITMMDSVVTSWTNSNHVERVVGAIHRPMFNMMYVSSPCRTSRVCAFVASLCYKRSFGMGRNFSLSISHNPISLCLYSRSTASGNTILWGDLAVEARTIVPSFGWRSAADG
jgi:hypothetical protein